MKIHLALWQETDCESKLISACGVIGTPSNFVYPKKSFLTHMEPKDICKRCKAIYDKKPW